jgi:diguanylate cyclase (GGDEF)-like protein
MIYLLKTLVLNRLLNVGKQVIDINSEAKFDHRIQITGKDELTEMVASLNSMLELIELTQEQLKYRISRRTKDMEKLSQLNRNLFKEMSKQRSIEAKLREDEKLLRQMAYYDTLTGLPNRALFNELLQQALTRAEHTKSKVAILFIDVDKFKKMNDTYGHDFGDKFLKVIATRLKQILKDNGVAARLAGDEFILFLSEILDKSAVDTAAASIFEYLTAPLNIDNIRFIPTFSIGISLYPDDGHTIEQIINAADLAMYYAKKQDGNSYRYYSAIENKRSSTTDTFI